VPPLQIQRNHIGERIDAYQKIRNAIANSHSPAATITAPNAGKISQDLFILLIVCFLENGMRQSRFLRLPLCQQRATARKREEPECLRFCQNPHAPRCSPPEFCSAAR
jgi:hypothetical protein